MVYVVFLPPPILILVAKYAFPTYRESPLFSLSVFEAFATRQTFWMQASLLNFILVQLQNKYMNRQCSQNIDDLIVFFFKFRLLNDRHAYVDKWNLFKRKTAFSSRLTISLT